MGKYGLTGGIGCGKSTVASFFAELTNVRVIDTDSVAKQIMSDPVVVADIGRICLSQGCNVIGPDGKLDVAKFKEVFFEDLWIKAYVERLVHPLVWKVVDDMVATNPRTIWLIESAIIHELGETGRFDGVITVTCSESIQDRRLVSRGYSEETIKARKAVQTSSQTRVGGLTINTDGSFDSVRKQVIKTYDKLTQTEEAS